MQSPPERHGPPPPRDAAVIAAAQDLGDLPAPEVCGPRVLRVLEDTGREALVVPRGLVSHHPGYEPGDRLHDDARSRLPAREHVVTYRDLAVDEVVGHPLVDSLVSPAKEREPRRLRRAQGCQFDGQLLVETPSARAEEKQRPGRVDRLDRAEDRLRGQHHPRAAPERGVVDRPPRILGLRTQVEDLYLEQLPGPGAVRGAKPRSSARGDPGTE